MSVADLHDLELIWPSSLPTDVIVTGTFDQWSSSVHLVKGETGFFGTVKVPWNERIAYKFIVDGSWRCRDDRPQEDDGSGNINNVLQTPENPRAVFSAVHDPPMRLSIPHEGIQAGGYGDIEIMVTAVEFLPQNESAVAGWGSPPAPIPQISVDDLALARSTDTLLSVTKLDTAEATEGTVPPASKIAVELDPAHQAPPSSNFAPRVPVQEPLLPPSVPEIAQNDASEPMEPQFNHLPQDSPGAHELSNHNDAVLPVTPTAALGSTVKQLQGEIQTETAAQGHCQQATPASSSTPASSTATRKKHRSLLARIKHMFDKSNDKQEKKEKNKH